MESIVGVFWNKTERRLRAGWRLAASGIGQLVFTSIASVPLIVIVIVSALTSGAQMSIDGLMDSPLMFYGNAAVGLVAALPTVWLAGRFLDRRKFADFGFHLSRGWWIDFGFGLFLGAALMAGIFFVERALGWIEVRGFFAAANGNFVMNTLGMLLVFVAVGFYEELLSRGYHIKNLAEGLNFGGKSPKTAIWLAVSMSSIAFGLMHFFNPNANWVSTLNIAIAGIFLGMGYLLTGELGLSIGLHITWNFFQGVVFGFPVSGMQVSARLIDSVQTGPAVWTGAGFGPEAGYMGLITIGLGTVLIVAYSLARYGKARLCLRLAEFTPRDTSPTPK